MTWAASWRMISSASGESRVRMMTLAEDSIRAARSRGAPSTLMASAALASPGPIDLAISSPVTAWGKRLTAPSGKVTATGASSCLSGGMESGLSQGKRGGNVLDRKLRQIGAAQNGDAGPARRGEAGIGFVRIQHGGGTAGGDDQMHRPGIVAERIKRQAAERDDIAETGLAGEVAGLGHGVEDRRADGAFGKSAQHHRRHAAPRREIGDLGETPRRPALGRPVRRTARNQQQKFLRQVEALDV